MKDWISMPATLGTTKSATLLISWLLCTVGMPVRSQDDSTTYGCKFSRGLCKHNQVCFDDNLFGSCQDALFGSRSGGIQFVLDSRLRRLLETVMQDLVRDGYSWDDDRTQCLVAAVLRAHVQGTDITAAVCDAFGRGGKGRGSQSALQLPSLFDSRPLPSADFAAQRPQLHSYDAAGRGAQRGSADGGSHETVLSQDDLQALKLFLRLSDYNAVAAAAAAPMSRSGGLPTDQDDSAGHPAGSAHRHDPVVDVDERLPSSWHRIDKELVNRLLKDEISVDELSAAEIQQLTTLINSMLLNVSARSTPNRSGSHPVAGTASSQDVEEYQPSNVSGLSLSLYVEGAMVRDSKVRGEPRAEPSRVSAPAEGSSDLSEAELEEKLAAALPAVDLTAQEVSRAAIEAATAIITVEPHIEAVDPSYGWVKFGSSVEPQEAKQLLGLAAQSLGINKECVTDIRVQDDEITFRLLPNDRNVTATELVKVIIDDQDGIVSSSGIPAVHSVGIGAGRSRLGIEEAAAPAEAPRSNQQLFVTSFVVGSCVVAVVIAVTAVCVVRKKKARSKLQPGLIRGDKRHVDADGAGSSDSLLAREQYEDLVRRRERTREKAGDEWPPGAGDMERISQEDYGSQRSGSASSWSEEPAIANMDVSTGHMVLSYMEDHLKNKERLDQEWQDLCSYEAEPGATDIALLPKNRKKNRYLTVLPYDHNRVVLDERNNVANEDYINASFIVDHDPRSPAYIATQGPLVHTVADFWQMVWEQGAVVIVMLTRLSEGSIAMCHRYWPHDSSELYHIYEVHLVSEHVWSDDYLVRSFYLKNLETNETRTVTQFHYIAWPESGLPTASKSLLDFRRKVNKSYRGRSRPVVVVCSDGAGRTGSFMLLDMVINRMNKGAKEIDLAATLEFIRDQRMGTVKTREQFEFILTSVAEEVQAVLRGAAPH